MPMNYFFDIFSGFSSWFDKEFGWFFTNGYKGNQK
ncbi:MAG: hypothetical protein ACI9RU_001329 [Litorivivens sp.]|jgi:hypothetical protein